MRLPFYRLVSVLVTAAFTAASCLPMNGALPSPLRKEGSPVLGPATAHGLAKVRSAYDGPLIVNVDTDLAPHHMNGIQTLATSKGRKTFSVLKKESPALQNPVRPPHYYTNEQQSKDIFPYLNPDDPTSQLPFDPSEGDLKLGTVDASVVAINGQDPEFLQTGALLVWPVGPVQTSLDRLKSLYGAEVTLQMGDIYLMQFDLTKVKLSDLDQVLRDVNQYNKSPIASATVSSVNAAKTIKLAAELMTQHRDLIASAEFMRASPAPFGSDPARDWQPSVPGEALVAAEDLPGYSATHGSPTDNYWWLKDRAIEVDKAWEYGMGGGVRVGYIDAGFQIEGDPEFSRRVDRSHATRFMLNPLPLPGNIDMANPNRFLQKDPDFSYKQGLHGMFSMAGGFAEKNGLGSVGSAPNATLDPMNCFWMVDYIRAGQTCVGNRVDLIVINMNWMENEWWTYADTLGLSDWLWGSLFEQASNASIPVIIAAHNQGRDVTNAMPSKFGTRDNVIVATSAGVYYGNTNNSQCNYIGHNYGSVVSIASPAQPVFTSSEVPPKYSPIDFGGTSFGTPVLGGIATLVIGAVKHFGNNRLSPKELKQALLGQDPSVNHISNGMTVPTTITTPDSRVVTVVNARCAVETALAIVAARDGDPSVNPEKACAKRLYGEVKAHPSDATKLRFKDTGGTEVDLLPVGSELLTPTHFGSNMEVVGWRLSDGRIEAARIGPGPTSTPVHLGFHSANAVLDSVDAALVAGSATSVASTARTGGITFNLRQPGTSTYAKAYIPGSDVQAAVNRIIGWATAPNISGPLVSPIAGPFSGKSGPFEVVVLQDASDIRSDNAYIRVASDYQGGYRGSLSSQVNWIMSYVSSPHTDSNQWQGDFSSYKGGFLLAGWGYHTTFLSSSLQWHEIVDFGPGGPDVRASDQFTNQQIVEMIASLRLDQQDPAITVKTGLLNEARSVATVPAGSVQWQELPDGTFGLGAP